MSRTSRGDAPKHLTHRNPDTQPHDIPNYRHRGTETDADAENMGRESNVGETSGPNKQDKGKITDQQGQHILLSVSIGAKQSSNCIGAPGKHFGNVGTFASREERRQWPTVLRPNAKKRTPSYTILRSHVTGGSSQPCARLTIASSEEPCGPGSPSATNTHFDPQPFRVLLLRFGLPLFHGAQLARDTTLALLCCTVMGQFTPAALT